MENSENKIKIASLIINGINAIILIVFIISFLMNGTSGQYKKLYKEIDRKLKISESNIEKLNNELLTEKKEAYKWYLVADTLQKNISNLEKEDLNIKKYYDEVYTNIDNYNEFQLDSLFSVINGDSTGLQIK